MSDEQYEKLARKTWGKTSADTSYEKRDMAVIAQALKCAALEGSTQGKIAFGEWVKQHRRDDDFYQQLANEIAALRKRLEELWP